MGIKHAIGKVLKKWDRFYAAQYRMEIQKKHRKLEQRHTNRSRGRYYIIRYEALQACGWTVYERVVLYNCIYAADHHMIPVVDMKTYRNIYQEEEEVEKINIWDKYYLQPAGVSLEEAINTGNYILSDPSQEWFNYIRMRTAKRFTEDFLRAQYNKYIRLRPEIIRICENRLSSIIPTENPPKRLLGVCLRGTDYIKYHHAVQPEVTDIVRLAQTKFGEYQCDYYFISTEDYMIFEALKKALPLDKVVTYNAGNVKEADGFIGEYLSKTAGAHNAALDYITTLYILNKCCCLVGGLCGATIVAKYRRNPPYEYINIIDLNKHY